MIVLPAIPAVAFNFYSNPIMIERYLYLPSVGFAILVAYHVTLIPQSAGVIRRIAVAGVLLVYGALTLWRAPFWKDQTTLFEGLRTQYPGSSSVHLALGETYLQNNRLPEVASELAKASGMKSRDARYHYASGWLNLRQNNLRLALQESRRCSR